MLAGQFVGGVNLVVARAAERRLVGAADHGGCRCLASVALYLYLHLLRSQNSKLFLSLSIFIGLNLSGSRQGLSLYG